MQTLSVEDMRRIVTGGERFLLVDIRAGETNQARSLPRSVQVPFREDFASTVLAHARGATFPVVVYGDRHHSTIVEKAAETLRKAGLAEVWSYGGDPDAWISEELEATGERHNVVSNPDEAHADRQATARLQG
jgi:rhodanese-related sulfurtransferase